MKYMLLILAWVTVQQAFGQTIIKGHILNKKGEALKGALVTNISQGQTVEADEHGAYALQKRAGDSLRFSLLGYYELLLVITSNQEEVRDITLQEQSFYLKEVEINPYWTPYQKDSIQRYQTYKFALGRQRASSSALGTVVSPFSALAEQFNKKSKQIKHFQSNYPQWEAQHFIDTRYTFEAVAALTHLQGDSLAAFINAYPMPVDFARAASELEIKMWILYNYRQWIKHPVVPLLKDTTTGTDNDLRH